MNARVFCLNVRGFTRYAVRETLALNAFKGLRRTFPIVDAKARTIVVTEVELGAVAIKMLLADMVIGSDDATLKDREIILSRVDVDEASQTNVFVSGVVHGSMA